MYDCNSSAVSSDISLPYFFKTPEVDGFTVVASIATVSPFLVTKKSGAE
jgi:hypothetical protein